MTLYEIIADLDAKIVTEEDRVTAGIAEAVQTHGSMHDGYWKRLWELRQKRRTAQIVADAIGEAVQ